MADRETIIAAHDAWRNAHRAYRDEAAKHLVGFRARPPRRLRVPQLGLPLRSLQGGAR